MKLLYSQKKVDAKIVSLSNSLRSIIKTQCDDVAVVGILKGGAELMFDLMRLSGFSGEYGFLAFASYGKSTKPNKLQLQYSGIGNLQNKKIILVDDIIDTGATIQAAINILLEKRVKSIDVFCLLKKEHAKTPPQIPIHFALPVENKDFVVGRGMGLGEKYRRVRDITVLEKFDLETQNESD